MPSAPRQNILLITSDQQHYDTLGLFNRHIQTPALDRLAREGTTFTRAYCNTPVCSPSRGTIITGMYPAWHGCWTIGVKLPEDVPTVGHDFQSHGYHTSLIGKAHFQPLKDGPGDQHSIECQPILRDLDFWRNFHGPWYGFKHVETCRNHADEAHAGGHYGVWMQDQGLKNWADHFVKPDPKTGYGASPCKEGAWDLPEEFHYTKWTADRTIADIEKSVKEGKPFMTWASFHDPHPPYLVSRPWDSMYNPADMPIGSFVEGEFDDKPPHFAMTRDRNANWKVYQEPGGHAVHGGQCHLHDPEKLRQQMAIYYGMISFMDREIGRILDTLDRLGIAENTLVVFSTDHGHFLGQHGLVAKGPFHYEDLLKVPFIVRQPGKVPGNKVSIALQGLVDLAPTFLTASGLPVPGRMQGVNQWDVWTGKQDKVRDDVVIEFRHQPTTVHMRTYVTDRYKLTMYRNHPYGELFDLQEDPSELRNLWDLPGARDLKLSLMQQAVNAEIVREPTRMPRVAGA